jgi:hypothetical protein
VAPIQLETAIFRAWRESGVLQQESGFRQQVADFYRAKGYQVRENPRVRGHSEKVYSVAMVADGPLGALLISFGDAGGVDAIEVSRVRTLARDIGATPVIASPELSPDLRRIAAQFAVVVVDQDSMAGTEDEVPAVDIGPDLRRDLDAHPWPASGRARPEEPPQTPASLRDVDDILSQLGSSKPEGVRARGDGAGLWRRPPAASEVPAPGRAAADPPAPPRKFGWLASHASDIPVVAPTRPSVDDALAEADAPVTPGIPDVEVVAHEATIMARQATLVQRSVEAARQARERWGLVRFGVGALLAAAILFGLIRWLT